MSEPEQLSDILHELRTYQLQTLPEDAGVVLSVGCSGLHYFRWFHEHYRTPKLHIGVEYYRDPPRQIPEGITWLRENCCHMPGVPDDSVDLLFSGQNVEHLWPEEVLGYFKEAYRVLRPGGYLVMDSPNRDMTRMANWSHWGHTVEYTAQEAEELTRLSGFDLVSTAGLYLCRSPRTGEFLGLEPNEYWTKSRRGVLGIAHPEDSFLWWITARKARLRGVPNFDLLGQRLHQVFADVWPERIDRLISDAEVAETPEGRVAITTDRTANYLFYGPRMVLRPGSYEATFFVKSGNESLNPDAVVGECQVLLAVEGRVAGRKQIRYADVAGQSLWRRVTVPFSLSDTAFGVQYRVHTRGTAPLSALMHIDLQVLG